MDRELLAERGVRLCLQGHQPFAAAVRAVHDTLKALREGTAPDKLTGVANDEMMKRYMRNGDYAKWMKDWL
jgi:oxaloacetate decarboxylase